MTSPPEIIERAHERGVAGLVCDPAATELGDADVFERAYWSRAGAVDGEAGGRRPVLMVSRAGHRYALRHYWRGGAVSAISRDRYVWTGAARTRPMREFRLLLRLSQAGLPVPAPVAARYVRHGLWYTGDILTRRIEDVVPLWDRVTEGGADDDVWRRVGACVRRFHDAGVFHADLNAHNVLVGSDGEVHVLDFDRGTVRAGARWKRRNLARLLSSLQKIDGGTFTPRTWRLLLDGYEA